MGGGESCAGFIFKRPWLDLYLWSFEANRAEGGSEGVGQEDGLQRLVPLHVFIAAAAAAATAFPTHA